jgi:hypothetical protein
MGCDSDTTPEQSLRLEAACGVACSIDYGQAIEWNDVHYLKKNHGCEWILFLCTLL